jgi:3-hydroxyisobutyrate dehydrogenase-like beta-hydroxyacid dehydrogenase
MKQKNIGILHPGQMGEYIAAMLKQGGNEVFWVSEGRSDKSRKRSEKQGLQDARTLTELCQTCAIVFSVCPPVFAKDVAEQILKYSFKGIYVDANAINPERSVEIGKMMEKASIEYVDGGIIGNPAWHKGNTSLYLSGKRTPEIMTCFLESNLEVHSLGNEIGKASAIKMCYASYTKGSTALLCGILALSEAHGVLPALEHEWSRDGDKLGDTAKLRASRVTAKAWRFAGEMEEIADTFAGAGLPDGFHRAAAELYRRLSHYKDALKYPSVEEVLDSLLQKI